MDEILPWWPDWLPTALQSGDSAIAIIGGVIIAGGFAFRYGRKGWRKRAAYRRRAQSNILDQLAIGRPLTTVETAVGQPHLISRAYHHEGQPIEERMYRLPGAWVTVQAPDGVIAVYTITITDPKLFYDTGPATLGALPVRLGRDTFADAPTSPDETFQIYAHLATFIRYYDFGCNAAGNQYLWLAFNDVGVGTLHGGNMSYAKGRYAESFQSDESQDGTLPEHTATTVNTLTVADFDHHDHMLRRGFHGPHPQELRRW
jgi:hypothetical protein